MYNAWKLSFMNLNQQIEKLTEALVKRIGKEQIIKADLKHRRTKLLERPL